MNDLSKYLQSNLTNKERTSNYSKKSMYYKVKTINNDVLNIEFNVKFVVTFIDNNNSFSYLSI